MLLLFFIMQLILYKKNVGLTVVLTLIYFVIVAAVDFTIAYLTALVLDTSAGYTLNTQSLKRVVCIFLSKSVLLLIVMTVSRIYKNTLMLIKKYALIMCIYSIFLIGLFFVMVELNMSGERPELDFLLTVFFMASLAIELLIFYFAIKMGESYEQNQK